ncbi:hypothetical protein ACTHGU_10965 [Chitinophagaceae bacterium MMS25-I14]
MFTKLLLILFTFFSLLYLLVILPAKVKRGKQSQHRFYIFLFVLLLCAAILFRYIL